jgi:hypothetical protein
MLVSTLMLSRTTVRNFSGAIGKPYRTSGRHVDRDGLHLDGGVGADVSRRPDPHALVSVAQCLL